MKGHHRHDWSPDIRMEHDAVCGATLGPEVSPSRANPQPALLEAGLGMVRIQWSDSF
jgi:hypothetical protein